MLKRNQSRQQFARRIDPTSASNFRGNRAGAAQFQRAGVMGGDRIEQGRNDWLPVKPAYPTIGT